MDEEFFDKLKYVGLRGLVKNWDNFVKMAEKGDISIFKFLRIIVEDEYSLKKENSRTLRLRRAQLPEKFVLETFPFERQPHLPKQKILSVYDSFEYIKKPQNCIWIGPTGCGKTGLATSFLIQALNQGYSGRSILFHDLLEMLYKARGDHSDGKMIQLFTAYDCLLIDELGYVDIEPVQAGLFFTLMNKRHKKKTTLVTSNLGFSEWVSFFKNPQLTAALIDRLIENSHVFNMKKCVSLRSKGESE